jgi:ferritin-like metal-binding protein YciE
VRVHAIPRPQRASPLPDPLLHHFRRIYASEARLALDLDVLFRRTRWLPLRLALSDQRKETKRHVGRIAALLPAGSDGIGLDRVGVPEVGPDLDRLAPLSAAAVVAGLLQAARAALSLYGAALAAATERGLEHAVRLLMSSLTEEAETEQRLAALAAEIPPE